MRLLRERLEPISGYASPAWQLKRLYEHNGRLLQASVVFDPELITLSQARKKVRNGVTFALQEDVTSGIKIPNGDNE